MNIPLNNINQLPDIITMGDRIFEPHWATTNHRSGACEFMFVMEGRIHTVMCRRRSFTTEPGGIILIPSGVRHRDEFDLKQGMKVFMISFQWRHEREYFKLMPPAALRNISDEPRHIADKLCENMRRLLESGAETDRLLCRAHLLTILLTLLHARMTDTRSRRIARRPDAMHCRAIMLRARAYLDTHYAEDVPLENIARNLRISPFYLSHIFSQENDFSLMEYLTNRRMQAAKLLLQQGTHSIKEAAGATGYRDGNYFSKVFHRHFGFAPSELRKSIAAIRT